MFELLITRDPEMELHDSALEGRARLRFDWLSQFGLAHQLGQAFFELAKREPLLLVAVLRLQVKQGEDIWVHDLEGAVSVGGLRIEENPDEPFNWSDFGYFLSEGIAEAFKKSELGELRRGDALAPLELEQGGARDGIHRFDATINEHRQLPEAVDVKFGVGLTRRKRARQPTRSQEQNN